MTGTDPELADALGAEHRRVRCAVCRAVRAERDRFLFWFFTEAGHEAPTMRELADSWGFCPSHTRAVLADEQSIVVLPPILLGALRTVDRTLASDGVEQPRACPWCTREEIVVTRTIETFRRNLASNRSRSAGDLGPLCRDHLATLIAALEPSEATRLAKAALRDFGAAGRDELLGLLDRSADTDFALRSTIRADRGRERSRAPSSADGFGRLYADLAVDACPTCHVGERTVRRYLGWGASQDGTRAAIDELAPLCPEHANDLAAIAPDVARQVRATTAAQVASSLELAVARLATLPGRGVGRARASAAPSVGHSTVGVDASLGKLTLRDRLTRSRRTLLRDAVAPVARSRSCTACAVRDTAEDREMDLLAAALRARSAANRYSESHGLCVRHALLHPAARATGVLREELRARIGVRIWQLDDAIRRLSWSTRHEPPVDVARTVDGAITLLDGHTFLGWPAPER